MIRGCGGTLSLVVHAFGPSFRRIPPRASHYSTRETLSFGLPIEPFQSRSLSSSILESFSSVCSPTTSLGTLINEHELLNNSTTLIVFEDRDSLPVNVQSYCPEILVYSSHSSASFLSLSLFFFKVQATRYRFERFRCLPSNARRSSFAADLLKVILDRSDHPIEISSFVDLTKLCGERSSRTTDKLLKRSYSLLPPDIFSAPITFSSHRNAPADLLFQEIQKRWFRRFDSRLSTIPCVFRLSLRIFVIHAHFSRGTRAQIAILCVVDDTPIDTGRDTRDCQPTGRAAGEYWHLFSHRYLLSSAKQRPTLSHYHEQLRHTDHGIENRVYGALHSSLPSSISLTNSPPMDRWSYVHAWWTSAGTSFRHPLHYASKKVQRHCRVHFLFKEAFQMIIVKNDDNYGEQLSKLVRKKLVNDDDASFSKEVFSFFLKRFLKTLTCSIFQGSFD